MMSEERERSPTQWQTRKKSVNTIYSCFLLAAGGFHLSSNTPEASVTVCWTSLLHSFVDSSRLHFLSSHSWARFLLPLGWRLFILPIFHSRRAHRQFTNNRRENSSREIFTSTHSSHHLIDFIRRKATTSCRAEGRKGAAASQNKMWKCRFCDPQDDEHHRQTITTTTSIVCAGEKRARRLSSSSEQRANCVKIFIHQAERARATTIFHEILELFTPVTLNSLQCRLTVDNKSSCCFFRWLPSSTLFFLIIRQYHLVVRCDRYKKQQQTEQLVDRHQ